MSCRNSSRNVTLNPLLRPPRRRHQTPFHSKREIAHRPRPCYARIPPPVKRVLFAKGRKGSITVGRRHTRAGPQRRTVPARIRTKKRTEFVRVHGLILSATGNIGRIHLPRCEKFRPVSLSESPPFFADSSAFEAFARLFQHSFLQTPSRFLPASL